MSEFFDVLETRAPETREAELFAALRSTLAAAAPKAPAIGERLAGVELDGLTNRAALAKLPVLRKSELTELQAARPPFGGLTTKPAGAFRHVFMSPGPIFEPGSDAPDWWRVGRALYAAGFRCGEVIHNAFAYHLTPAGMMFDSAAKAVGCAVTPGGVGNTEQQAAAIAAIRPTGYAGTPDFLKALLDKGAEAGLDLSSIKRALVSGGALFPSLRQEYADRGIACLQCYATADLGLIAYETAVDGAPGPGMIVDERVIVEIVRPGTGDPVPEGEVGEVVVTSHNPDYPLLRFATGDLSAVSPGQSACGRTNMRIKGWMGRADQRTKVRGMFIDAPQVDAIVKRHPEVSRARAVVTRTDDSDALTLRIETSVRDAGLADRLGETASDVLKLRAKVELLAPGALPNDGKVVEDARDYDA